MTENAREHTNQHVILFLKRHKRQKKETRQFNLFYTKQTIFTEVTTIAISLLNSKRLVGMNYLKGYFMLCYVILV